MNTKIILKKERNGILTETEIEKNFIIEIKCPFSCINY